MIIIGLGNPGEKFANTRHNVGFMAIDKFAEKNNFPEFIMNNKFLSQTSEKGNILLAKPQTFMNNSGKAARKILSFKEDKISDLIVINDDLDLPFGQIKIVKNRGSAGQKGVESIINFLGTEDFIRIRIGILPTAGKPRIPENFVIQNFKPAEKEALTNVLEKTSAAISVLINDGLEKAMNIYNQ